MVKNLDDDKLGVLVDTIDETLMQWALINRISPDMMLAIVLARMTLVAKETDNECSFIALLDKARYNIMEDTLEDKGMLH